MTTGPFYHNAPITESNFFKRATESFLLQSIAPNGYVTVSADDEPVPEMPRDEDFGDQTRIIIINKDQMKGIDAYDDDRLTAKIDIDKVAELFGDIEVVDMVTVMVFNLYSLIKGMEDTLEVNPVCVDNVEVDFLAAIIAICLSDPLDVWFHIWVERIPETDEFIKYCQLMAVKPRAKN